MKHQMLSNKSKDIAPVNKKELLSVKIESSKKRLYCTHCGHKFFKPESPINYKITCDKCYRPIELTKK